MASPSSNDFELIPIKYNFNGPADNSGYVQFKDNDAGAIFTTGHICKTRMEIDGTDARY